jgi:predicted  nucleic acid-binding Zn-ribbon protein
LKNTSKKRHRLEVQYQECEKQILRLEDKIQEERRRLQELEWELVNLITNDTEGVSSD